MPEARAVRENVYRQTERGHRLIGAKCADCGRVHFPKPDICLDCLSEQLHEQLLAEEGVLLSWSTVHMRSAHFEPPYTVAYVDLPEGVRLFSTIGRGDGAQFAVGMRMRVEVVPLWTEQDGTQVTGHRFVPA